MAQSTLKLNVFEKVLEARVSEAGMVSVNPKLKVPLVRVEVIWNVSNVGEYDCFTLIM